MTEAIIVALITATASIIGQWLISRKQRTDETTARAVKDKEVSDRLERIEERLDEHNNYAERYNQHAERLNDIAISLAKMSKDIEYLKQTK